MAGMLISAASSPAFAAELHGDVRAKALYDSNIARSSAAVAAARGVAQDDVIGDILATFDLQVPMGRQTAFVTGSVGYQAFRRNSQFDGLKTDVQGGVNRQLGRCEVGVSGAYARAQSDLSDISREPAKNMLERRAVAATVGCSQIVGLAPSIRVSQEWVENSAASRQDANSDTLSGRAGLVYRGPALGAISLYGEYEETAYPNRLVLVDGALLQDGFKVYTGGLRYERELGARIQGSLFGSYTTLRADLPAVPDFKGITYGAALTYRMGSRITTSLSFDRDVKPSNRLDSTYALSDAFTLEGSYALGRRMTVSLGGSQQTSEIQGLALRPGIDVTDDETRAVFGAVNMKLNERISLSVDARHEERQADVAGFDYTDDRVGLSAAAAF